MNAKIKHKLACFIRNPTVNPECYKIACKNICTFYQIFIQKFGSRVKHNSPHNGRGDPTVENTTICSRVLAEIEPIAQTNPIKSSRKKFVLLLVSFHFKYGLKSSMSQNQISFLPKKLTSLRLSLLFQSGNDQEEKQPGYLPRVTQCSIETRITKPMSTNRHLNGVSNREMTYSA